MSKLYNNQIRKKFNFKHHIVYRLIENNLNVIMQVSYHGKKLLAIIPQKKTTRSSSNNKKKNQKFKRLKLTKIKLIFTLKIRITKNLLNIIVVVKK